MRLDLLDITEDEAQGLAEIAQLDLAMARAFSAEAQAKVTTEPEAATKFARSYHRCTRSYRQTLGLKARLQRELTRAVQEAQGPADGALDAGRRARPGGLAVARRVHDLRTALTRLAWDEAERPETEGAELDVFMELAAEIAGIVADESLTDAFCDEPVDDHVAQIARVFDFPFESVERWRDLPDPPAGVIPAKDTS